ncbi:MAG: cellulase N-terminal Ig-like domain-containing protein, partial [Draconibacterium sp.]|nr:cellulase N-terminal Ig-like domain-containing protein [Draconibacterium sp.]
MKKYGVLLFIFCILFKLSSSQFALNGTVQIIPYQGLQPELIEGVTALPAVDKPLLRHVCLVNKNIISLTIDEQAVIYKSLVPYKKQTGDTVLMKGYHGQSKVVKRKGEEIGYLCGVKENWLRPFNVMAGEKLDVEWILNPENFQVSMDEGESLKPIKVYRKTYPNRRTHVAQRNELAMVYEIYLVLSESLKNGKNYILNFEGNSPFKNPVSFLFDENQLRSEAIHVNLAGYEPDEPKVAFLSMWMGDGGSLEYEESTKFNIIDIEKQKTVYQGISQLVSQANKPEFLIGNTRYNHNLTDVHSLDFSEFKLPGKYRLVVPGIGCSFDFEIRNNIWEDFTRLNMKGFLHQRSGIELGPPYTDYLRPRNMHPADEVTIHKCDVEKFFGGDESGQQGVFTRVQNSILTDTEVSEAWGSWMDAGDFDQRMSHLY